MSNFSRDAYSHYLFTPRELTNWCLSLFRYNLSELKSDTSVESVLKIWAYEGLRIFYDRLVERDARKKFNSILSSALKDEWRSDILASLKDTYFISWEKSSGSSRLPSFGKILHGVNSEYIKNDLATAINRFSNYFYLIKKISF